jgi:hypothetical protein
MVSPAGPGRAVRALEQRVDLGGVEVGEDRLIVVLRGDCEDARDEVGVLGVTQRGLSPVGRYPQSGRLAVHVAPLGAESVADAAAHNYSASRKAMSSSGGR